jgi:hypothetical protein
MLVWVCRADPPYNDWEPTLFPITYSRSLVA